MKTWIFLCVVGIGAFWTWALTARGERTPLPEEFVGHYRLYRFEPPKGKQMANPYAGNQVWYHELRADGTYRTRVLLPSKYEMTREDGVVEIRDGALELTRISTNLFEDRGRPADVYQPEWRQDKEGRFLLLVHKGDGHSLYWRPIDAPPALTDKP